MKKILSILFLVIILIAGCSEDFLDRSSLTDLADDTFWTTEADAKMALAGCYSALQSRNLYDSNPWAGGVQRWDYMTDDGGNRWGWMQGGKVGRGEYDTSDGLIRNFWRASYGAIGRTNRVIEVVPTLGDEIISEASAKQIVAEAKFIRALIYNLLSMTYEDVPLVTTVQDVAEANIPKNSKSEIVEFIISDLEGSVEDLSNPGDAEWGRATKGAGYALLARINLYNKNWTAAATWSQKVIDMDYSLFPDFHGLFQNANEVNNEVIFPVCFMRGPDENGSSFAAYWGNGVVGYSQPLSNLGEDYFCIDGQPSSVSPLYNPAIPKENRDPRFDASLMSHGGEWRGEVLNPFTKTQTGYAQRKYTEEHNSEDHFDAEEDFYVFRLGEILLMRSEALAESDGSSTDIFALINQLRNRAGMIQVDQAEVDNYFGGSLVEMVRHERRIETAFEGLRYLDLKRWGIQKERSIDFYMSYERANNNKLKNRYWDPKHVVWPIPQEELDVNTALVQNSLWQ